MKKRMLVSLVVLFITCYACAQSNPIFYGGLGDGTAAQAYKQTTNDINKGALGDGWNSLRKNSGSVVATYGGPGDGWGMLTKTSLSTVTNTGGMGDGWQNSNYQQLLSAYNKGGNADGWSRSNYAQTANQINQGGQGDGWASIYTPVLPLPVSILSFDAVKDKNRMASLLEWKMSDEQEIAFFEVERSANAVHFSSLGQVLQDDALEHHYYFTDSQPLWGNNYYRIKLVKKDGRFEYTNTRVISFEQRLTDELKIYPNPASRIVTIEPPSGFTGTNVIVNIFNSQGAVVWSKKIVPNTDPVLSIDITSLASGSYFVHLATDTQSAIGKIEVAGK